jgi:hypothetical protein
MIGASIASPGEIPLAWTAGMRLPETWRLWLSTETSHDLRILRTTFVKTQCYENWTMIADFPKQATGCANCCPIPAIGIALSSNREVRRMRPREMSDVPMAALESAFNRLETPRRNAPIMIEKAWAANLGFDLGTFTTSKQSVPTRSLPARTTAARAWSPRTATWFHFDDAVVLAFPPNAVTPQVMTPVR